MPVACHAAPDHRAVEHVERGEQRGACRGACSRGSWSRRGPASSATPAGCGRAPGPATSRRARGRWRGAAGRGTGRRRPELLGEGRVGRQLEAAHPMRRQARLLPDLVHLGRRNAARLGHRAHRPVRRLAGRRLVQGPAARLGHLGRAQRRDPRRPGPIAQQPVDAGREIALLPAPDRRLGQTRPAHDLRGANPSRRQQHHLSPPDMLLRAVSISDDRRCQTRAIRRTPRTSQIPSHPSTIAQPRCKRNLSSWTNH